MMLAVVCILLELQRLTDKEKRKQNKLIIFRVEEIRPQ